MKLHEPSQTKCSHFVLQTTNDVNVYWYIGSQLLQEDLTALENWENRWQMSFNPSKCTVIRVAPNKSKTVIHTNYQLHGHTLEIVDSNKYLVTLTSNLSWDKHVSPHFLFPLNPGISWKWTEYLSVLCLKVSIYQFCRKQLTKLANLLMHSQCALSEPISSSRKTRKLTVCRFI